MKNIKYLLFSFFVFLISVSSTFAQDIFKQSRRDVNNKYKISGTGTSGAATDHGLHSYIFYHEGEADEKDSTKAKRYIGFCRQPDLGSSENVTFSAEKVEANDAYNVGLHRILGEVADIEDLSVENMRREDRKTAVVGAAIRIYERLWKVEKDITLNDVFNYYSCEGCAAGPTYDCYAKRWLKEWITDNENFKKALEGFGTDKFVDKNGCNWDPTVQVVQPEEDGNFMQDVRRLTYAGIEAALNYNENSSSRVKVKATSDPKQHYLQYEIEARNLARNDSIKIEFTSNEASKDYAVEYYINNEKVDKTKLNDIVSYISDNKVKVRIKFVKQSEKVCSEIEYTSKISYPGNSSVVVYKLKPDGGATGIQHFYVARNQNYYAADGTNNVVEEVNQLTLPVEKCDDEEEGEFECTDYACHDNKCVASKTVNGKIVFSNEEDFTDLEEKFDDFKCEVGKAHCECRKKTTNDTCEDLKEECEASNDQNSISCKKFNDEFGGSCGPCGAKINAKCTANPSNVEIKEGHLTKENNECETEDTENIKACIIGNKKDVNGNSYDIIKNKYCVVSCKEDFSITTPGQPVTRSGQTIDISGLIDGTKTCYTSRINTDLYFDELGNARAKNESTKKIEDEYNACFNWTSDISYDSFSPKVSAWYEESYGKLSKEGKIAAAIRSEGEAGKVIYKYNEVSNAYTGTPTNNEADVRYIKVIMKKSSIYSFDGPFYQLLPDGTITLGESNKGKTNRRLYGLPVEYRHAEATYEYKITFEGLGEYYSTNNTKDVKLGRIMGNEKSVVATSINNGCSGNDLNNKNEYACKYDVDVYACPNNRNITLNACLNGDKNTFNECYKAACPIPDDGFCTDNNNVTHQKSECRAGESEENCRKRLCPIPDDGEEPCVRKDGKPVDKEKWNECRRDFDYETCEKVYCPCPDCPTTGEGTPSKYYCLDSNKQLRDMTDCINNKGTRLECTKKICNCPDCPTTLNITKNVSYKPIATANINPNDRKVGVNWEVPKDGKIVTDVALKAATTVAEIEEAGDTIYDVTFEDSASSANSKFVAIQFNLDNEARKIVDKYHKENPNYANNSLTCYDLSEEDQNILCYDELIDKLDNSGKLKVSNNSRLKTDAERKNKSASSGYFTTWDSGTKWTMTTELIGPSWK